MASSRGTSRHQWIGWLVALLQIAAWHCAGAADIHWRTDNFNYVAQNRPLKDFIREFASSQGLNVVVDPQIDGTVNGKFNLTPQSMLELLAMSFGLTWYYDGSVLYFYPAGDLSSEVVQLGSASADQLQAALTRLNIIDKRYPITYDRSHQTARIAGPKRYVELVKETVDALERSDATGGGSSSAEIRVFPLRYAWAADFTFTQGGTDHVLPGVASVLRELYSPTQRGNTSGHHVQGVTARTSDLNRMRGLGYFRDDQVPAATAPAAEAGSDVSYAHGVQLPQFQPDGRMNAVIVRDRPERMASYEAVIRSLDVKPGLVEIEARILEISSDAVDSLGVDWRARSGSASVQLNPTTSATNAAANSSGTTTSSGGLASIAPTAVAGGSLLTTVLGDSGRFLIARVNALSQEGKANMLESPRVLTLDNVEAVLENLSEFFVPVSGNLDAQLYDITAGTSLRVTPLIVTEGGKRQIKLAVRIEDGSISTTQTVSQIPVVQRSTIDTQAFIKEGDSLLIGGYQNDVRLDTHGGVPGLASMPILGKLFQYNQKQVTHVQRMFMLTPRIVDP